MSASIWPLDKRPLINFFRKLRRLQEEDEIFIASLTLITTGKGRQEVRNECRTEMRSYIEKLFLCLPTHWYRPNSTEYLKELVL